MPDYTIRKFTPDDSRRVVDILNHYVDNSFAAFPESRMPYEFIDKLIDVAIDGAFYVAESPQGETVGFALLRRYHNLDVFRRAAELTFFILPAHVRAGLGRRLLAILIEDASRAGVETLLVQISSLNGPSIAFHQKHGFTECGRFRRIGLKRGKDFDVVWMQRFLGPDQD